MHSSRLGSAVSQALHGRTVFDIVNPIMNRAFSTSEQVARRYVGLCATPLVVGREAPQRRSRMMRMRGWIRLDTTAACAEYALLLIVTPRRTYPFRNFKRVILSRKGGAYLSPVSSGHHEQFGRWHRAKTSSWRPQHPEYGMESAPTRGSTIHDSYPKFGVVAKTSSAEAAVICKVQ